MKSFLKVSLLVIRFLPSIATYYFSRLLKYSRHPDRYPIEERYSSLRKLVIKICKGFNIDLRVENRQYLTSRRGQTLLVSNHLSVIDILLLIALSPTPVSFVAKDSVKRIPVVGRVLVSIDGFFLDRKDPREAIKIFRSASENIGKEGLSYTIYPEGTRNKYPLSREMRDFHPGSFKLAYKANADVLAFAEFGTQRILSSGFDRSNLVQVKFFPILKYEDIKEKTTSEVASFTHDEVAREVSKMKDNYIAHFASRSNKRKPQIGFKVD